MERPPFRLRFRECKTALAKDYHNIPILPTRSNPSKLSLDSSMGPHYAVTINKEDDKVNTQPTIIETTTDLPYSEMSHKPTEIRKAGALKQKQHLVDIESQIEAKAFEKFCHQNKFRLPSLYSKFSPSLLKNMRFSLGQQLLHPEMMGGGDSILADCIAWDLLSKPNLNLPKEPSQRPKPVKAILADFPKPEYFDASFRRLPTAWFNSSRPHTPLQKAYSSAVKMPIESESQRRRMIDQAVNNGHLYRRIKKAQTVYNRKEQLKDFKKHEAFVQFHGPVADMSTILNRKHKNNNKRSSKSSTKSPQSTYGELELDLL